MLKKRATQISVLLLGLIIVGILVILGINNYAMERMVEREIETLIAETAQVRAKTFSYKDLAGLPEPVQRYFRYALNDGQEYIRSAKITASGQFRRPATPNWASFKTHSYIGTAPPALIFDAVMKQNAVVWFDVRDKYTHEKGDMYVNLFSGINVLNESDVRELNITTLLRWAGEAVLFPTALLPSQYVRWEPIDKDSAKLIITDGNNIGTYHVCFSEVGEIIRYESNDRYDRIDGIFHQVGSIAYRSHYREIDGIKVPTQFLVVRILPDGTHEEFWKGEVTSIQFNNLSQE
jgi:hypothetical protein